jgi:putative membrane protein
VQPEANSDPNPAVDDVSRRTWLAAERTWLAWWRTGLATAAVAIAVGRLLPPLTHGAHWPFEALGIGYAALAVGVVITGAARQRRTAEALRRGGFDQLSERLVLILTAAVIVLVLATLVVIAAGF